MKILDGNRIAQSILSPIAAALQGCARPPGLAFLLVGENPASAAYVRMKKKRCKEVGILSLDRELPATLSEEELLAEIRRLNEDPAVDGILVQLPLPAHIRTAHILKAIDPRKDVDGFHPLNVGKLLLGETDGFLPCTPRGIHMLLQAANVPLDGAHVVIVGRSNIVGKPLAAILMQKAPHCNATVTVAHSHTRQLAVLCQSADVLIAAMGRPRFISPDMVRPGAVVVDVGINRTPEGSLVGDVDFEAVAPRTSLITPVPGGVGPMTIAMLLSNTLLSYQRRMT
jgi:methylenetetrahydrofolate dehydrogenase (NADP+)/methenyltetrahydrofolate cyclohydrolase